MARLIEIASCFSRLLNVLTGGSADLTFSARAHRDGLRAEAWVDALFLLLTGEPGHCQRWWQEEVRRSALNVAAARARNRTS